MNPVLIGCLTSIASAVASVAIFAASVLITNSYWLSIGLVAVLNAFVMVVWRSVSNGWKYAVGFTTTYAVLGIGLPILGGIKSFILASIWVSIFLCTIPILAVTLAIALFKRLLLPKFRKMQGSR